jgi:hypothetical protein
LFDEAADHIEAALIERLLQIPVGAGSKGLDRLFRAPIAGDHDAGHIGVQLADLPHELESVDPWHADVAENQVYGLGRHHCHGFGRVSGARNAVSDADQDPLQRPSVELLVVDDEDVGFLQDGASAEREGARGV